MEVFWAVPPNVCEQRIPGKNILDILGAMIGRLSRDIPMMFSSYFQLVG